MAELAQFVITLFLGYIAARSAGFWSHYTIAIFGILAIPTLAVFFMAGDESALWEAVGAGMGIILLGMLSGISALFQNLPVMTAGMLLGVLLGSGVLR